MARRGHFLAAMTGTETGELRALVQRLYGGPLDAEPGDIVVLKSDVADIKKTVNRAAGAVMAASGIIGFLGLSGIVALFNGLGVGK